MFVGHYSASFAAKAIDPRLRLGPLFVAAQLVNILWCLLLFAGVERVDLVPGYTATNDYVLEYVPYSHGLTATVGWAALAVLVWTAGRRWRGWGGSALLVGPVVLSHWFADLISHTADLPLYGDRHKVGLGLWNHPYVNFAVEAGLLLVSLGFYYRATRPVAGGGRGSMALLVIAMIAIQGSALFGPRPDTAVQTAGVGLLCYAGFAVAADYFDRQRTA